MQALHPGTAAATHVGNLAHELERLGEQCTVLSPSVGSRAGLAGRAAAWLRLSARSLRYLRMADVLYVRTHPASILVVAAARLAGVPTVQEVNGPNEDFYDTWTASRRLRWLLDRVVAWQLRHAASIATVTRGLESWAAEQAPTVPTRVIPNGVDADRFSPSLERPPWLPDSYVVFVGTLTPWQGLEVLLAATAEPKWPPRTVLIVVGDGIGAPLVEAAQRATPGRVRSLGARSPREVVDILTHAEAATILSRDRRGTGVSPLKLFEAMACACPVIVGDRPDMGELVRTERCGLVVPPDDPSALAAAVHRIVEDEGLGDRLGAAGRAAARLRHTWSRRAVDTRDLLRSAADGRA